MMLTPYLQSGEAATAGPPTSRHAIDRLAASLPGSRFQLTSTRPCGVDSAPYFAAFVASSCSTIATVWVAATVQRDVRALDVRVCVCRVGRELTADELGEINAVPAILAEQRMSIGHGLNAPIQCLNILVDRVAALAHIFGDDGNARQQIFDAMIERGDEQALLVLRQLARGDVESKALEAYKTPYGVEFGLCLFPRARLPGRRGA